MSSSSCSMSKSALDQLKKSLAKRSFNVKFDLEDTDYKPLENIGIGAYGVVCSAIHKKTQDKVAIKKIPQMFHKDVIKRTYREIKILKHFKHDNIISIRELLKPKSVEFQEIYVVFDLMESDLHRIIYTDQELSEEHTRYFLYQILRGLKYIHSANVIHRDLKPSNLLVNEDCHVRIGDFGMARGVFQTPDEPCYYMTQYVATRWYRAPEILLALVEYGTAVDMWSVGCIFAEMLGRKNLFPGKDYINQIKLIVGVLGTPSQEVLSKCHNDTIGRIMRGLGHKQPVAWKTLFPKASKKAIDLLSRMLTINPVERISVEKALEHPFLSKYHDPDDEPICVPTFNFDFEKENLSQSEHHDAIYQEIMEFHQPKTPTLSFSAVLRPAPKACETPSPTHTEKNDHEHLDDLLQALQEQHQQAVKKEESENTVTKDDQIFKKPVSQRSMLVSVDTNALVPPQSGDIEMLSAKSTDGKQEMEVHPPALVVKADAKVEPSRKPPPKPAPPGTEIKTISSDTKALIKQALLNSSQRKIRTEPNNEDSSKPKVKTAAQRQKERQDKRERKKNKLLERQRKQREKQGETSVLSTEDKALLERWSVMLPKIAPASGIPVVNSTQGMGITLQGGKVTVTQSEAGQPAPMQTIQIQAATPQQVQVVQPVQIQPQPGGVSAVMSQSMAGQQDGASTDGKSSLVLSHDQAGGSILASEEGRQNSSPPAPTNIRPSVSPVHLNQGQQYFSTVDPRAETNSCIFQSGQNTSVVFNVPNVNSQTSLPSSVVQTSINTSPSHPSAQGNLSRISVGQFSPPMSLNSNIPQDNVSVNSSNLSVTFDGLDFLDLVESSDPLQSGFQFHPYPDEQSEIPPNSKRHSIETSMPGTFSSEQPFPQHPLSTRCRQTRIISDGGSPEHGVYINQQPYQDQIPFSGHRSEDSNLPFADNEADVHYKQEGDRNAEASSPSRTVPGLKISCSTSSANSPQDLIAILSKRFSKSQVEDPFPPPLSLTPKGTGGGYGVGADLDALMLDVQDNVEGNHTESPLSSSLIADWLDVRGNISVADIEALEREMMQHSPMAVFYNDQT